jgi:2-haloacid dehalogenase
VDEAGIYKPHPAAYTLATDRLGLAAHEVCLVSSNGWDVAGAASFGLRTVWVARGPDPVEALGVGPDARAGSLAEAARLLLEATGAARDA